MTDHLVPLISGNFCHYITSNSITISQKFHKRRSGSMSMLLCYAPQWSASPAKVKVTQRSCREEGEEEVSMTPDANPADYDEFGTMDSWTNDVREMLALYVDPFVCFNMLCKIRLCRVQRTRGLEQPMSNLATIDKGSPTLGRSAWTA